MNAAVPMSGDDSERPTYSSTPPPSPAPLSQLLCTGRAAAQQRAGHGPTGPNWCSLMPGWVGLGGREEALGWLFLDWGVVRYVDVSLLTSQTSPQPSTPSVCDSPAPAWPASLLAQLAHTIWFLQVNVVPWSTRIFLPTNQPAAPLRSS